MSKYYTVEDISRNLGLSTNTVRTRIAKAGIKWVGTRGNAGKGRGAYLYSEKQQEEIRDYRAPDRITQPDLTPALVKLPPLFFGQTQQLESNRALTEAQVMPIIPENQTEPDGAPVLDAKFETGLAMLAAQNVSKELEQARRQNSWLRERAVCERALATKDNNRSSLANLTRMFLKDLAILESIPAEHLYRPLERHPALRGYTTVLDARTWVSVLDHEPITEMWEELARIAEMPDEVPGISDQDLQGILDEAKAHEERQAVEKVQDILTEDYLIGRNAGDVVFPDDDRARQEVIEDLERAYGGFTDAPKPEEPLKNNGIFQVDLINAPGAWDNPHKDDA